MEELNDFRKHIETHLADLTKSQQQIATFLLSSYDEAAFMSAADLAKRLEVSEATIVRFAKAIGYDGFPELRRRLQELFRTQVTPASRLQRKLTELSSSPGHVLNKIIDMEIQYLREAERTVSTRDFDQAVEMVLQGKRVFVHGSGPSAILAELLELRLRRLGIFTIAMTESGRHLLEKLQLVQAEDTVVVAGFHRARTELFAVLDYARSVGGRTIFITDTLGAAFRDKADIILAARRGPVSTFHSMTVPMVILNALILAVAMARPRESLAALDRLEHLRSKYELDTPEKKPVLPTA